MMRSKNLSKILLSTSMILLISIFAFSQSSESFNFKKNLRSTVKGSFQYSFSMNKDGDRSVVSSSFPSLNYSGVNAKLFEVKFSDLEMGRKNHEKYRIDFDFKNSDLAGFELVKQGKDKYLKRQEDVLVFVFKANKNSKGEFVIKYKLVDDKKNLIFDEGTISQRYNITGVGDGVIPAGSDLSNGPIADFSQSGFSIVAGTALTLRDVSKNNTSIREWKFTGGSPAASKSENPVVFYHQPGTYPIELTVTDSKGESNTKSSQVVVTAKQAIGGIQEEPKTEALSESVAQVPESSLEDSLFNSAKSTNSLELFKQYKETYPEGKFLREAEARINQLSDINIISNIEAAGVYNIELEFGLAPIQYEILNNPQGVTKLMEEGLRFKFKIVDEKDHVVNFVDARGKKATMELKGASKPLIANYKKSEQELTFTVSGGQAPYFAELINDKTGINMEFPLGDCKEPGKLSIQSIKNKLGNKFGDYTIIVKDNSKAVQKKLDKKFKFEQGRAMSYVPPTWAFLILPLIILIGLVIYKNK